MIAWPTEKPTRLTGRGTRAHEAASLMKTLLLSLIAASAIPSIASGALTLTINEFNSTTLSFTISGVLDEPTSGQMATFLFVAAEKSVSTPFYDSQPTLVLNNVTVGGVSTYAAMAVNGSSTGYSVMLYPASSPLVLPAGTEVSGTITFSGNFTSQPALSLWSGMEGDRSLNRLEAVGAIPEPSSALLLGSVGLLGMLRRRR